MRIRALVVVTPLIALGLFVTAGAAGGVGQVTVSNAAPAAGSVIAVNSTGWRPGDTVTIALSGVEELLASPTADPTGAVHVRVTVPAGATLDAGVLSLTGTASSGVPQQIVTALAVQRRGPATAPTRPWLAALVLAAIAGALLLASVHVAKPAHNLAAAN
jgi:hypothetical protein